MSNAKKLLGEKIKYARRDVGLSQRDISDVLEVSDKTVSSYEVGRTEPTFEHLQLIAKLTKKPISYFSEMPDKFDLEERLTKLQQDIEEIKLELQARRHKNMTSI